MRARSLIAHARGGRRGEGKARRRAENRNDVERCNPRRFMPEGRRASCPTGAKAQGPVPRCPGSQMPERSQGPYCDAPAFPMGYSSLGAYLLLFVRGRMGSREGRGSVYCDGEVGIEEEKASQLNAWGRRAPAPQGQAAPPPKPPGPQLPNPPPVPETPMAPVPCLECPGFRAAASCSSKFASPASRKP